MSIDAWNYRIVEEKDGNMGLHEVYYFNDGTPQLMTERAICLDRYTNRIDMLLDMKKMIKDLKRFPEVLSYKEFK